MLWNANNTFSFERINWGALAFASTITTVSRYMKFRMWAWGQNPIVIPNGIPRSSVAEQDAPAVAQLREASGADHFCFKIGRFDPDKRWLMAVTAMAYLKQSGSKVMLVMRGGREPHGAEVLHHARGQGLHVVDVKAPDEPAGWIRTIHDHRNADVVNVTTYLNDDLLGLQYAASDAVIANSGHEPFGLVGLEVMAAGGLAITGSTGEDYAEAFRNAMVLETNDPVEVVTLLRLIKERPDLAASIRKRGRTTARDYAWEKVIDQLLLRIDLAAAQQAVRLESANVAPPPAKPVRRRSATRRKYPKES
jgi:glycosyltransferase involved in cell wall biosynthesis